MSFKMSLLRTLPLHTFGVNAWKQWVLQKNDQMVRGSQSSRKFKLFKTDLLQLPPDELNYSLSLFVKEVRKPNGEEYGSGSIYYLCLGIQKYLFQNGRIDNIFSDPYYEKFTECLNDILLSQDTLSTLEGFPSSRIEEETLWESKQLGAHSPYALLNTVMYFNTKFFKLKTAEDHLQLSFNHMYVIYEKKSPEKLEKTAFLRYYPNGRKCERLDCKHSTIFCLGRKCMLKDCKHKDTNCIGRDCEVEDCDHETCLGLNCDTLDCKHAVPVCIDAPKKDPSENPFQQIEHATDSLRCPVRLYEFYLSKCPENCRSRNDMFYLHPERSCVPDSAVWYSGIPLSHEIIAKMMQRIKIVREIYEN